MKRLKRISDTLCFGYDFYGEESKRCLELQKKFISEIKKVFPELSIIDRYSETRGFRKEVLIPEDLKETYYQWIFSLGWFEFSINCLLMNKKELNQYLQFTNPQYS